MPSPQTDFFNLAPQQLAEVLGRWGESAFRATQVIAAAWTPGITRFSQATSLPAALRIRLDEKFLLTPPPEPKTVLTSKEGTVKTLWVFADGAQIESVAIPMQDRLTFCLSTQWGCALGCGFCATARLGFHRDLTAGEILAQIRGLAKLTGRKPTHLVFMGMGEPLQNLDAVRAALAIITHPKTMNWSPRKTTVSTSGWLPGIEAITRDPLPANLAFSLNAAQDKVRSRLMPVNRRYPLNQVLTALRAYAKATGEAVMIEYVLIKNVNDDLESARLLGRLLKNLPTKINIIPWNPIPGMAYQAPLPETIRQFQQELRREHLLATVRSSRGTEIGAACGQLAGPPARRAA